MNNKRNRNYNNTASGIMGSAKRYSHMIIIVKSEVIASKGLIDEDGVYSTEV